MRSSRHRRGASGSSSWPAHPRARWRSIPAGATRRGLRRGTRCGDRVAIRQRRLRSGTGVGRRPGPAQSRGDRRGRYGCEPSGQARHVHHPHRHGLVADPVGSGLVASLAHPGGNVTGLSIMATELSAKRLQLLKEAIPRLARVAVLCESRHAVSTPKVIEELKAVAPSLSIELSFVSARTPEEFGPAFSAVSRAHAQALYVIEDPSSLLIERRFSSWRRRPATSHLLGEASSSTKAG